MKIKEGYILKQMGGRPVGIYVGDEPDALVGMIQMNDMGAFVWQLLEQETTREQVLQAILDRYDVDAATAGADLDGILSLLKKENILA